MRRAGKAGPYLKKKSYRDGIETDAGVELAHKARKMLTAIRHELELRRLPGPLLP